MLPLLVIVAGLGLVPKVDSPTPAPVTLTTRDGVKVYGDAYAAFSPTAPLLLLFHQAGSSRAEYATLAPRLVQLGYNALAIDERSGGQLYGVNRTQSELGKTTTFLDVLPDMEAALKWAKATHPVAKIILVGSSFTASLVFELAAKHPGEIAGVAAFSPSEYFPDPSYVRSAARRVHVPVFIDSGSDPEEIGNAKRIFDAVGSRDKQQYRPKDGIHGASTLRDDRDPAGAADNFNAFVAFLRHVAS